MNNIRNLLILLRKIDNDMFDMSEIDDLSKYILSIDNNRISYYFYSRYSKKFKNDLEIIEMLIQKIIHIYELYEEYEMCSDLMIIINEIKKESYEYIEHV